jgi:hypothetical protein
MLLTLLGLVLGIVLLVSLLLARRYRAPRPDRAAILYQGFVRKSGVPLRTGETPVAFAARARTMSAIDASVIDDITSDYLVARYGRPDPIALRRLEQRIRQLHQRQ